MKKKYLKPGVKKVVVMPHFNLMVTSNLNVYDKQGDTAVDEDNYDDLL